MNVPQVFNKAQNRKYVELWLGVGVEVLLNVDIASCEDKVPVVCCYPLSL
jgi:hypothetical protein